MIKPFNVRVHRDGGSHHIGQVHENNEELARCAALSKFGVAEEDILPGICPSGNAIFPEEEFDVSPA